MATGTPAATVTVQLHHGQNFMSVVRNTRPTDIIKALWQVPKSHQIPTAFWEIRILSGYPKKTGSTSTKRGCAPIIKKWRRRSGQLAPMLQSRQTQTGLCGKSCRQYSRSDRLYRLWITSDAVSRDGVYSFFVIIFQSNLVIFCYLRYYNFSQYTYQKANAI